MPLPRHVVLIVLFWLGATAWLVHRDVWPRLRPGEPPPFSIDLADEARAGGAFENRWLVYKHKDGKRQEKGYARSQVRYHPKDDTYELLGKYKLWADNAKVLVDKEEQYIESMYRITREGDLREVTATGKLTLPLLGIEVEGEITGKVEDRVFRPRVELKKPISLTHELQPVEVSARGSVLNPLQPLNRLPGLRRGQRWRVPLVLLTDLIKAQPSLKGLEVSPPSLPYLDAEVQADLDGLVWGPDGLTMACLVIDYHGSDSRGEEVTGRTYVRASDYLILQQEMKMGGEHLTLVREYP